MSRPHREYEINSVAPLDTNISDVVDEKKGDAADFDIAPADDGHLDLKAERTNISHANPEMRAKIVAYYGRKAEEDHLAPKEDVTIILDHILAMTEQEAMDILVHAVEFHQEDPNFPGPTMEKIRLLIQGYKAADMEESDWLFDLKTEACMIYYHSPYPEVRSVTDPFDDPTVPVETFRAYCLGMIFMAGSTALNTFFSPRQPAISLSSSVLQLLLAPCGLFWAKWFPDWGFNIMGKRISINPGPWTYKEQTFSTIMFTVASGAGATYYVYLVQKLPQYLNQDWVSFGYEILLALNVQIMGFGFAGILRRFVVYPYTAIWPKVLPTLALNRALVNPERKEVINGWRYTRYQFFMICFVAMFFWFWIPNSLFQALHLFNWMTWIAPNNFNLGMITGSYGGMGFNPWATFDWNVSGSGYLITPWWSTIQQYFARVLSGLIIIGMYWGNYAWAAYTPINSNESFTNKGEIYNVSIIMGDDGYVNIDAYKEYGPPFFSGANVFGQGAWFAWYPLVLFYYSIRHWPAIKRAGIEMYEGVRYRKGMYEGNNDPHTRMISVYNEVPEWWFFATLMLSFGIGVAALAAYPTHTPWWVQLAAIALNLLFLIPGTIMQASANVGLGIGLFFQMLAGTVFAGNPQANIISNAIAGNLNSQADTYISDQKMAHYAKLPPRAVFRAQMIATFLNCFIFIGMLNWMVTNFNEDGSLCTWSNAQHFVCTDAVLTYATAVEYGAFGIPNLFKLYPILPWCFLMGSVGGIGWALLQKFGPRIRERAYRSMNEVTFYKVNKYFFGPVALLGWFDPAVTWSGALNWTGGNNLSYATNGTYISYIFMYHIKRRFPAWWEKYNYLLEAGFDVGVAISGIIQTFVFAFTNHQKGITLNWWGNTVGTAGQDFQSYNQTSTLLPIPDVGYFGPAPGDYPMKF
ncbi:oligopeptide transporter 2 [Kockovaella imperatae]|uniref:Oligopeptide transporter 2 n=1 Tax=Kockovaella imperatae TaxID=4999 RepID=A0A1Y1UG74_9TREE|nr:oligopeptide transporter 2 [Kockovaella imperatae]ORX37028.1 oligopeptide transporter 2 [Kockovaella imperatae]